MLQTASPTNSPAPYRHARRTGEPAFGTRLPLRWDQLTTRDRVALSLLLHPDRELSRAG